MARQSSRGANPGWQGKDGSLQGSKGPTTLLGAVLGGATLLLLLAARTWPAAPTCTTMLQAMPASSGCVLYFEDPSQPLQCIFKEDAANQGPCSFNTSRHLGCTFALEAELRLASRPGCAKSQASVRFAGPGQRQLPERPAARRAYPSSSGTWGPPPLHFGRQPGWQPSVVFRPGAGDRCPAVMASSAMDLAAWAGRTGIRRIVMSGDSTMRQFFNRAITLARAQPVTVDIVSQRYAHYKLQQQRGGPALHDSLWFSGNAFPLPLQRDPAALAPLLAGLHRELLERTAPWAATAAAAAAADGERGGAPAQPAVEAAAGAASVAGGPASANPEGDSELTIDLVMGTLWTHQAANMRAYMRDVLGAAPAAASSSTLTALQKETVFVLSACYWHKHPKRDGHLWPGYKKFVREAAAAARAVVLLTCPLPPRMPRPAALAARNAELREFVAGDSTGGLLLLDADMLLAGVPAEATISPSSIHFQCSYYRLDGGSGNSSGSSSSTQGGKDAGRGPVSYPRNPSTFPARFDAVKATQDGACEDAVDFSLWQALLCLLEGSA